MSVDLKIIPIESKTPGATYGHTMLPFATNCDFLGPLGEFAKEKGTIVDFDFYTFEGEEGAYAITKKDAGGDPLRILEVWQFLLFFKSNPIYSTRQKAVLAYLVELDPQSEIILYWH